MSITPAQSRAGRGLINWSQEQLAERSNVARNTIARFESGATVPGENNMAAIRRALEGAGVEFTNGDAEGVRLRVREIEAVERSNGEWGVKASWTAGAPVEIVSPATARDAAVEAERRGDLRLAERLKKAAVEADRRNNRLDEEGNQEGWTTVPPD